MLKKNNNNNNKKITGFYKRFEKLQKRTRDDMGPLAKLWKNLKDAKQVEDESEADQISVNELLF